MPFTYQSGYQFVRLGGIDIFCEAKQRHFDYVAMVQFAARAVAHFEP